MSEAATTAPRVLTVPEAAEQLRVTRGQIYNLINAGVLAHIRYPKRTGDEDGAIRIEQSEIDAFIQRNRVTAVKSP
jgi:excisionase family DNA binding protein